MSKQSKQGERARVDASIFERMELLEADVAGIDIGSEEHYVSVREDRAEPSVRKFGCFTPDLASMAAWLKECGVRSVVMESTGVYWIPAYQVLEEAGFKVLLVDAHHAKNVPGRKTDVWDCRWLRQLHMYGLLRGCFIPAADVVELRTYWRHRATLVESCSQQVLRMQKALEQMNLQIHKALSDITGLSGMRMLRAILSGQRDPKLLASMCDGRVKASQETLVKALTGHYKTEHLFTLKQALATYDFLHQQIKECDEQIKQTLSRFQEEKGGPPPSQEQKGRPFYRRKNQPHFDLEPELRRIFGVNLMKIDGMSVLTAMTLLSECGPDLSRFPTEKRFCSWLALSPNHRITGGKIKSRRTRKGKNRLATALCLAAQSLHRSKSAMGAYYRRMRAQHGTPKAITATAHRIARMIYMMLTRGEDYVDQGQAAYEQKYKERQMRSLKSQAARLGLTLVETATGAVVS